MTAPLITATTPPITRVALYARVSTSHQVEHQTIDQQLERLRAHAGAQRRGR